MDLMLCDGMSVGTYQSDGMDLFCSIAMDDGEVVPVHNSATVGRPHALYQASWVMGGGYAKQVSIYCPPSHKTRRHLITFDTDFTLHTHSWCLIQTQASSFVDHMLGSLLGPNVTDIAADDVLSTAKAALAALYSRLSGPSFLSRCACTLYHYYNPPCTRTSTLPPASRWKH